MRIKVKSGGAFSNYCPHPVGTYLHCTFDPNVEWSGTVWVKQEQGNYLVSSGATYVSGSAYGSNTHTLTIAEMPNHQHQIHNGYDSGGGNTPCLYFINGSNTYWSNTFSGDTGGGQPHNNMPQSIAAPLWLRTK